MAVGAHILTGQFRISYKYEYVWHASSSFRKVEDGYVGFTFNRDSNDNGENRKFPIRMK